MPERIYHTSLLQTGVLLVGAAAVRHRAFVLMAVAHSGVTAGIC